MTQLAIRATAPDTTSRRTVMVTDRTRETEVAVVVAERRLHCDDVVALVLTSADGVALPSWEAGAHIDLVMPNGLVRQYSLCGSPQDPTRWMVSVRREQAGRGGSAYVFDHLAEGDRLVAVGPRNHFRLEPAASYRFLAGGIGITPILPMIEKAEERGDEWTLTYCGRTRASLPFVDDRVSRYGERVRVHADDRDGLLDVAGFMADPQPGERLYACGPTGLLDAVEQHTGQWPRGTVHWERFTPRAESGEANTAFEVELALSGTTLSVPADRSILDVVTHAGVPVLSSCTEGTCGTCETRVLSGDIDHRDSVLSPEEHEEGEVMMICVSRARSCRLVLEL
jgi:ferredoxin-NADP reductase